mgnify:CR=1 FL=1
MNLQRIFIKTVKDLATLSNKDLRAYVLCAMNDTVTAFEMNPESRMKLVEDFRKKMQCACEHHHAESTAEARWHDLARLQLIASNLALVFLEV